MRMSKEHVVNCRCGLVGVSNTYVKQPFVALLASVVGFLAKASRFFAVFDRSVPDETHIYSCLKLQFRLFLCQTDYLYHLRMRVG